MFSFPLVGNWVAWQLGNGRSMRIGQDPWVGSGKNFKISEHLITRLKEKGISYLASANSQHSLTSKRTVRKNSQVLGLTGTSVA